MTCSQAEYLSPLYWSGELEAQAIAELESHLKECPHCAQEFEHQQHADEALRGMVLAEPVDDGAVRERVRESLWPSRPHWQVVAKRVAVSAAGIAAVALVSFAGWNIIASHTSSVPTVYADAAQDHYDEVVKRYPRGWLTSPADINAFIKEHAGDASVIPALAPAGYHIDRVRLCELEVSNYVHLVYTDGEHDISFFIRQQDGETLAGKMVLKVKGTPIHAEQSGDLYVSGFQSSEFTVLVVTGESEERALHFAVGAANALLGTDQSFNLPDQVRGMALDKAAA